MWDSIRGLVADGVTIFLTTQYLEEADRLADRIALLDRGAIFAQGTSAELKRSIPGGHLRLEFPDEHSLLAAATFLGRSSDGGTAEVEGLALRVPGDSTAGGVRDLLVRLDAQHIDVTAVSVHTPDLDDVFLAVTGRAPEAAEAAR